MKSHNRKQLKPFLKNWRNLLPQTLEKFATLRSTELSVYCLYLNKMMGSPTARLSDRAVQASISWVSNLRLLTRQMTTPWSQCNQRILISIVLTKRRIDKADMKRWTAMRKQCLSRQSAKSPPTRTIRKSKGRRSTSSKSESWRMCILSFRINLLRSKTHIQSSSTIA